MGVERVMGGQKPYRIIRGKAWIVGDVGDSAIGGEALVRR